MIRVTFNDEACDIQSSLSLHDFLALHHTQDQYYAVAINSILVTRAIYKETILQSGDRIDIIIPMQGG